MATDDGQTDQIFKISVGAIRVGVPFYRLVIVAVAKMMLTSSISNGRSHRAAKQEQCTTGARVQRGQTPDSCEGSCSLHYWYQW